MLAASARPRLAHLPVSWTQRHFMTSLAVVRCRHHHDKRIDRYDVVVSDIINESNH